MADPHESFRSAVHPEEIQRFVPINKHGKRNAKEPSVTIIAVHPGDQEALKKSADLKRVK